jgi:hypothetical protein
VTQLVQLPLWEWLALLLTVAIVVGPPSAYFGAKYGARQAIAICSARHGCAMVEERDRRETTQNLRAQLDSMHKADPELFARLKRAMNKALADTDPNLTAIPERPRADKDNEGNR